MKPRLLISLILTHISMAVGGFAVGIYALPILIAPPSPSDIEIQSMSLQAGYSAEFNKDLKGSDALHWGEGTVSIGEGYVTLIGKLAPGPDYKLYLSPEFVETEVEFEQLKSSMVMVGDIKTFENFVVEVASDIDLLQFNTVVVWCETFGEFITSSKYR
jgi:hypothetical protein